ncbi:hypothetical protein K8R30_01880 [archaeon]|nr:hypothetical protein [archaeon]
MGLVDKLLGKSEDIKKFLAKAKKDEQTSIIFGLSIVDTTSLECIDSSQYDVKMTLSYKNGKRKTQVYRNKSDLFTLTGLIPEQKEKYLQFEENLIKKRNRICREVSENGFEFNDPTKYKQNPLDVGI